VLVRRCTEHDIDAVQQIYGLEVLEGSASFETEVPDVAEMTRRFHAITQQGLPYLVAEIEQRVAGYAYASPYRTRPAYRFSLENSVYVARWARQRGVAGKLLDELIASVRLGEWRQLVAVIGDSGNVASIGLHERAGFRHVGVLKEVGRKHDRWIDTVLMQLAL